MQELSPKVAIIGGGNVGIRYAYALMIRGLARHIIIVDIDIEKVQGEIMDLSHEFNVSDTLEAKLSKDADQLDLILELKEQLDLGNLQAKEWLSFAVKRLLTESGRKLAQEILISDRDSWWFDKKTDWWINGSQDKPE